MLRSVKEVISILANNKELFEVMFEKRNMPVTTLEAESHLKSTQSLAELEQLGLITSFRDTVTLGGDIEAFLDSLLVAGGGNAVLYNYSSLFMDIDNTISLYYKSISDNRDGTRHLKSIYGLMKKIPHNLVSTFNKIRIHVEFTYKSAHDAKEKIDELYNYKESLEHHSQVIDDVKERLIRHNAFFDRARDPQLYALRNLIDETIMNIRMSLIRLTEDVVRYINRAEQGTRFYKHLQGILELCDRRELVGGTNVYKLAASERFILASGYTAVPKKHRLPMLHPEFCMDERFEKYVSEKRGSLSFVEPRKAQEEEIEEIFFGEETIDYIDYEDIMAGYIDSGDPRPFLHYLMEACADEAPESLLDQYISLIVVNESRFKLLDTYTKVGNRLCMDAVASKKSNQENPRP